MEKQKVIVYIDGFNFYHGMKDKGWRKYYWLDVVSFFEKFMKQDQELLEVKYFSAPSLDDQKRDRQNKFFQANKTNNKFILVLGKYFKKNISCFNCKKQIRQYEEKRTDVNIATQLILDVVKHKNDISILVTADSDLIPPLLALKDLDPNHKVLIFFPPKRFSNDLKNHSNFSIDLDRYETRFKDCQFNKTVELNNKTIIKKPEHWN